MRTTSPYCDGLTRRDFVQMGLGGALGLGMTDLLRVRAAAAERAGQARPEDINCILLWMDGGPTHYETFDPKPDAPKEVRGELKPIKTNVPGIHFCEAVPKLAQIADKFTVIRSICHKDPNHGGGNHYMMTGTPTPMPVNCGASATFHPSFGSMVSHTRGTRDGVPAYVGIPHPTRSGGPNFLGAEHAPFIVDGDPNEKDFKVRDVVLPPAVSEGRAASRRKLRSALDRMARIADAAAEDPTLDFDTYYQQAIQLVASPKVQAAFDINKESDEVRDLYGRNVVGQRLLLCRRLIQVGASFVTYQYGGWDHHGDIFNAMMKRHAPRWDQGLAALITDLDRLGMLDNTMVISLGEFGRTPTINKGAGRDHWPHAMSVLMAGAGIPGGQVVGATDVKGYHASENVHSPEDFAASVYTKMGIDHTLEMHTNTGRPIRLVYGGTPIKQLFT
jgi:uncharacterized protein (DUF1501 family)